jgi:hypothetical protein
VQYVWGGLANQARGADRFRGFLKRKIREWMAPMERFIFWAISRGFIPEVISLRSISSSVSVQGRPAGRGPVISPSAFNLDPPSSAASTIGYSDRHDRSVV